MELNIGGTEWVVIIFAALVLILGTNRLPGAARKFGRLAAEYRRAKNEMSTRISAADGPVETERQKFEAMARTMGIQTAGVDTEELRKMVEKRLDPGKAGVDGSGAP